MKKRLIVSTLVATILALGLTVGTALADGCGPGYCSYYGQYWSWTYFTFCDWHYVVWDNGGYSYSDSCTGEDIYYILY